MTIRDSLRTWFVNLLDLDLTSDKVTKDRLERLEQFDNYYKGDQPDQLKVKANSYNDNVTINLCKLIVDKSVSALVGDPADGRGMRWEFPDTNNEAATTWLEEQWDANNKEIFLHKNALGGAISGFPVIKIVPDGMGNIRLVNLDAEIVFVETDPQDKEEVTAYIIRYVVTENKKQVGYMEEIKPNGDVWVIDTKKNITGNRWELIESVTWDYDFPPILTWQNLPAISNPYGCSDIEGIIPIQDRLNYTVSNISKIIRLFAFPNRYGKNLSNQMVDGKIEMGPDDFPLFQGEGEIVQMQPVADMPGAMAFASYLRESMFAIAREVDVQSMKDKVGAITNFALKVLYRDFLDKLGTKRLLYGNAYQELNRRLLILGNFEGEICTIYWPDPLPVNQQEETAALQADINMGLVSVQTAREIRDYDHEQEMERMGEEKAGADNAGAVILRNFFNKGV